MVSGAPDLAFDPTPRGLKPTKATKHQDQEEACQLFVICCLCSAGNLIRVSIETKYEKIIFFYVLHLVLMNNIVIIAHCSL